MKSRFVKISLTFALAALTVPMFGKTIDPKGDRLYLADLDNRRIRMIDRKTNVVTTVAGNGSDAALGQDQVAADAAKVSQERPAVAATILPALAPSGHEASMRFQVFRSVQFSSDRVEVRKVREQVCDASLW